MRLIGPRVDHVHDVAHVHKPVSDARRHRRRQRRPVPIVESSQTIEFQDETLVRQRVASLRTASFARIYPDGLATFNFGGDEASDHGLKIDARLPPEDALCFAGVAHAHGNIDRSE